MTDPQQQQQEQQSVTELHQQEQQAGCLCICNSCICVCCGLGLTDPKDKKKNGLTNSENNNEKYFQQIWIKHGWQLLKNPWKKIEIYVSPVIANYFLFLHLFFVWLLFVFFLGLIFFPFSFYTLHDNINPANPVCNANFSDFYMCPLCDNDCDFWYLKVYLAQQKECSRHYRLLVDNPLMWGYCFIVLISALVLSFCVLLKTSSKPLCVSCSSKSQKDQSRLAVGDHSNDRATTVVKTATDVSRIFGAGSPNISVETPTADTNANIPATFETESPTTSVETPTALDGNANVSTTSETELPTTSVETPTADDNANVPTTSEIETQTTSVETPTADGNANVPTTSETGSSKNSMTDNCSLFILWICTIGIVFLLLGSFFGVFLANSVVERKIRKNILNKYGITNTAISSFIKLFFQSLLAIGHAILNLLVKNVFENLVELTAKCLSKNHKFFIFWTYNSFLAYFPILFRIFLYGQITGDPEVGYRNIGDIRFQHCPSYGCIDVGVYVFFFILVSIGGFPTLSLIGKMIWNKDNQYKKNSTSSSCHAHKECCTKCMKCCLTPAKCFFLRFKDGIVNHYVELSILYGYIIFFLSATGIAPLLASVIVLPIIARHRSTYYAAILESLQNKSHKHYNEALQELKLSSNLRNIWSIVFFSMTLFAMLTNFSIIIPNSRFIQHVAYSSNIGHAGSFLNFDGYLNDVFPEHNLTTLIQSGIFPHYTAHQLAILHQNGEKVRNSAGEPILYLPFINFACLKQILVNYSNFTRDQYVQYVSSSPMNNHIINYDGNSKPTSYGECFNTTAKCRSRGILRSNEVYTYILNIRQLFLLLFVLYAIPLVVGLILGPIICYKLSKKPNSQ